MRQRLRNPWFPMDLLGTSDLIARWTYSRQGVNKLARTADFPPPLATINQGYTRVWRRADIEAYEQAHREVLDDHEKRRKQVGYYLAKVRGDDRKAG